MHQQGAVGGHDGGGDARMRSRWRLGLWTVASLTLLAPLIAMQFTDEVAWSAGDFIVFGAMLLVAGALFERVVRSTTSSIFRTAMGILLGGAFLLIWANGAVGLIGAADNPANLMYGGVLTVGVIGALLVRARAIGMSRVCMTMAGVQLLITAIALMTGAGGSTTGTWELIFSNGAFALIWLIAAWFFRRASAES